MGSNLLPNRITLEKTLYFLGFDPKNANYLFSKVAKEGENPPNVLGRRWTPF